LHYAHKEAASSFPKENTSPYPGFIVYIKGMHLYYLASFYGY